jgi:hypothetical protein
MEHVRMRSLEPDQIVTAVIGLSQHNPAARLAQQSRRLGEASLGQGRAIGIDQAEGSEARGQEVLGRMRQTLAEIGVPAEISWERDIPPAPDALADAVLTVLSQREAYSSAAARG